jgi:peptidyl-prolyl cis-trans isomerase D
MREFYKANADRFPVPADPAKKDASLSLAPAKPAAATDDFPKVRAQVEAAMKQQAAARRASQVANDFTVALYDRKLAANSPELAAFVAASRHPATVVAPFNGDNPPAAQPWLANYGEQVSRLGKDRFFSDPLPGPNGFIVLLWQETLPSYKPLFAEVRDKVAADYKDNEKRKRFVEQGKVVRSRLEAAVKAGTAFEKAAADQKLTVKTYANFTLRQPPQDFPYPAFGTLQSLAAGQVADMVAAADKGYFVFAAAKKLPDVTPANPRYAEIRTQLMQLTANASEGSILSSMVEEELKKSAPVGER